MPELFNVHGFGPPHPFTGTSTWPWVDHLVSGLPPTTFRPVQTRFRYGSAPEVLNRAAEGNSPVHYAKGTRSHPETRNWKLENWYLVSSF